MEYLRMNTEKAASKLEAATVCQKTYIINKVAQKSLLLWEKGDHEVVDEELLCDKNTSSVGFAATFPRWGRLLRKSTLVKLTN